MYLQSDPLRAFSLASRLGLRSEAIEAARMFRKEPLRDLIDRQEMASVPVATYLQVVRYRERCAAAACMVMNNLSWVPDTKFAFFTCYSCRMRSEMDIPGLVQDRSGTLLQSWWWFCWMQSTRASLRDTPIEDILQGRPWLESTFIKKGFSCERCLKSLYVDMDRFVRLLVERLKRVFEDEVSDSAISRSLRTQRAHFNIIRSPTWPS